MKRVFVDANVFLRLFTQDIPEQADAAEDLMRAAEAGEVELITGSPVLFEVAWELRRIYKRSSGEVLEVLERIHAFPGLRLTDAPLVARALQLARERRQSFADAYISASVGSADCDGLATFNRKHFAKLAVALYDF